MQSSTVLRHLREDLDCYFDTMEERASQIVLDALTEQDFQGAFQARQEVWQKVTSLNGKVTFLLVISTASELLDNTLYVYVCVTNSFCNLL